MDQKCNSYLKPFPKSISIPAISTLYDGNYETFIFTKHGCNNKNMFIREVFKKNKKNKCGIFHIWVWPTPKMWKK